MDCAFLAVICRCLGLFLFTSFTMAATRLLNSFILSRSVSGGASTSPVALAVPYSLLVNSPWCRMYILVNQMSAVVSASKPDTFRKNGPTFGPKMYAPTTRLSCGPLIVL